MLSHNSECSDSEIKGLAELIASESCEGESHLAFGYLRDSLALQVSASLSKIYLHKATDWSSS